MISVYPTDKQFRDGFVVSGHSKFGGKGADIVCAGISSITHMTLEAIKMVARVHDIHADGYSEIHILTPNHLTDFAMDVFLKVYDDMQKQYPEQLEERE